MPLNFLSGEAKMAIYLTRRDRILNQRMCKAALLWKQNEEARMRLEFCFYKETKNLEPFKQLWGWEERLCKVTEEEKLILSSHLL